MLIFGISPISGALAQAFTPQNPNFAWWITVALSGGLLLLLSLVLGTVLAKRSRSETTDVDVSPGANPTRTHP